MSIDYFKDQIKDELCGAKDYIILALENKSTNPMWAKQFVEMSSMELTHATTLYNMFNEYYKTLISSYSVVPDYLENAMHEITTMYTERIPKIKIMHEMYAK